MLKKVQDIHPGTFFKMDDHVYLRTKSRKVVRSWFHIAWDFTSGTEAEFGNQHKPFCEVVDVNIEEVEK